MPPVYELFWLIQAPFSIVNGGRVTGICGNGCKPVIGEGTLDFYKYTCVHR